jgi:hypothetical protein
MRPSAVTTSAARMQSIVSPYFLTIQPIPPPSVSPPTPTLVVSPDVSARPWSAKTAAAAPQVAPAPMRTSRDLASSTSTESMPERSTTTPPVLVPKPGAEWPPLRMDSCSPLPIARAIAAATSAASRGWKITAGAPCPM